MPLGENYGMPAGSRVTAQAVKEKCSISAEFEKSQVMAVYIWRQSPFTLEWMYNEVTLEPGAVWHTEINYTCSPKAKDVCTPRQCKGTARQYLSIDGFTPESPQIFSCAW
ncbi:MAG: hypothetical protein A2020_03675 [Lentisphaerae bacterium GWF2_45_14]|nr:MAG: hypothetical protein A2020_03675 [Lentisphaerae bacterium GWF2_45_14]